jgi:hypothetical protein
MQSRLTQLNSSLDTIICLEQGYLSAPTNNCLPLPQTLPALLVLLFVSSRDTCLPRDENHLFWQDPQIEFVFTAVLMHSSFRSERGTHLIKLFFPMAGSACKIYSGFRPPKKFSGLHLYEETQKSKNNTTTCKRLLSWSFPAGGWIKVNSDGALWLSRLQQGVFWEMIRLAAGFFFFSNLQRRAFGRCWLALARKEGYRMVEVEIYSKFNIIVVDIFYFIMY